MTKYKLIELNRDGALLDRAPYPEGNKKIGGLCYVVYEIR